MMLGPVVCSAGGTGTLEKTELGWASQHHSQWNLMSMALVHRGCMLLFTTPRAVVLSVCMGVWGCLWPISVSVIHCGTASRALM